MSGDPSTCRSRSPNVLRTSCGSAHCRIDSVRAPRCRRRPGCRADAHRVQAPATLAERRGRVQAREATAGDGLGSGARHPDAHGRHARPATSHKARRRRRSDRDRSRIRLPLPPRQRARDSRASVAAPSLAISRFAWSSSACSSSSSRSSVASDHRCRRRRTAPGGPARRRNGTRASTSIRSPMRRASPRTPCHAHRLVGPSSAIRSSTRQPSGGSRTTERAPK